MDSCYCLISGQNVKCVDLSYNLSKDTIYWPTDELGFQLCMNCSGSSVDNTFYSAGTFSCAEHGGTHIDAPYHFNAYGKTVDMLELKQLIGPLRVIDISHQIFSGDCILNADYELSVADIELYESMYGMLKFGDILLIHTSWSRFYEKGSKEYLGFDRKIDGPYNHETSELHFPGISADASSYLVSKNISAVGLDTASLDPGRSKLFESHRILLGSGIYGIENINYNIKQLPPIGATLMAMPLKLVGGSGSPARIVALIPDSV